MEKLAQWKNTLMENVISQYVQTLVHLMNGEKIFFNHQVQMRLMKLEMMAVKTKMTKWKNRTLNLKHTMRHVNIWNFSDFWKAKATFNFHYLLVKLLTL